MGGRDQSGFVLEAVCGTRGFNRGAFSLNAKQAERLKNAPEKKNKGHNQGQRSQEAFVMTGKINYGCETGII